MLRKLLMRSHTQGLCTVSSEAGTQGQEPRPDLHTRQLCFLQLFLRHTLRGTPRELDGASMHSRRIELQRRKEQGREGAGVGDSRVFLVPIHNCKFPSPYLCSPGSYRALARLADSLIQVCLSQTPPTQTRKTKPKNMIYFSAMALSRISIIIIEKFCWILEKGQKWKCHLLLYDKLIPIRYCRIFKIFVFLKPKID